MKRFYSHYTFIYPDRFLKNYIVELDEENRIVDCYPFSKEVSSTEYSSGLQIFVPQSLLNIIAKDELCVLEPQLKPFLDSDFLIRSFSV